MKLLTIFTIVPLESGLPSFPNLVWSDVIYDQEMETAEIIAAMKRNDIRGVVQVRRYYLHTLLTRISDYLRGVGHATTSPMKPIAISSSD